jgi:hypothetical protein
MRAGSGPSAAAVAGTSDPARTVSGMYRSVLFERSCYLAPGPEIDAGCWSWATVGLAVGLAVRQLALLAEDVGFWGWPGRLAA